MQRKFQKFPKLLRLTNYLRSFLKQYAYACGYAKRYPLGIPLGQRGEPPQYAERYPLGRICFAYPLGQTFVGQKK